MSAPVATPAAPRAVAAPPGGASRVLALLRSEWTKTRSVRSTYWSLFAAVVAMIGLGLLIAAAYNPAHDVGGPGNGNQPWARSLHGILLAQIAVGVLGILAITSEFSTGMIRSTLTAVPQRLSVLAAKGTVFASVVFVITLVSSVIAFLGGELLLDRYHVGVGLGGRDVLRTVIGCALYLTVLSLFALALGTLIRHSAGAIASLFGILLVLPLLSNALPSPWQQDVGQILPGDAGSQIAGLSLGPGGLSPWVGFAVFCAWTAGLLVIAGVTLQRRDV